MSRNYSDVITSALKKTKNQIHTYRPAMFCRMIPSHLYTQEAENVCFIWWSVKQNGLGLKLPMGGLNFTRREAVN